MKFLECTAARRRYGWNDRLKMAVEVYVAVNDEKVYVPLMSVGSVGREVFEGYPGIGIISDTASFPIHKFHDVNGVDDLIKKLSLEHEAWDILKCRCYYEVTVLGERPHFDGVKLFVGSDVYISCDAIEKNIVDLSTAGDEEN